MWLLVIPPQMTKWLQPLDTHWFALYKTELILAYQEARVRSLSDSGDLNMGEFLGCVYQTIRRVLEGRPEALARAFDQDGFWGTPGRDARSAAPPPWA